MYFNSLNDIERYILTTIILTYPGRPARFVFGALYGNIDIKKYTEDDIKKGLKQLVDNNLIKHQDEYYIFTREQFLNTRKYFSNNILWNKVKTEYFKFYQIHMEIFYYNNHNCCINSIYNNKNQYKFITGSSK